MNITKSAFSAIVIISIFLSTSVASAGNTWKIEASKGDIFRYTGIPYSWKKVGGPGKAFVVAEGRLYGLSPDSSAVYQYTNRPGQWKKVGGPAERIIGGNGGFYAISPNNR